MIYEILFKDNYKYVITYNINIRKERKAEVCYNNVLELE